MWGSACQNHKNARRALAKIILFEDSPRSTRESYEKNFGFFWAIQRSIRTTKNVTPKALSPDFDRELIDEFKQDTERLSKISGGVLLHWNHAT